MVTTLIVVERQPGRHRVVTRSGVLRAQLTHNDADRCRVGLLATTALLLGGDDVSLEVVVGPDACLELFDVAGTVAYHGRGAGASWRVAVEVAPGGMLVWSGQPFVVADGADVTRTLRLDLSDTSRLWLRETLVLGRTGQRGGRVANLTSMYLGAELVLLENQILDPTGIRDLPGMLGGHRVVDTVLSVAVPAPEPGPAVALGLVGGRGTLTRYLGTGLAASPLPSWPAVTPADLVP